MRSEDCSANNIINYLLNRHLIFWDFDGVIKDSVGVKSLAYENLFLPYGEKFAAKIKSHHEQNSGVSRIDKIYQYLTWAGESATPKMVRLFCDRFSQLTLQAVVDSPWVPGVFEYLQMNSMQQYFVLVTATPQYDIEKILEDLNLTHFFKEIYGSPATKSEIIKSVISKLGYLNHQALMIGDSEADKFAAETNSIPFLLRRTPYNLALQASYYGLMYDNF